VEHVIDHSLLPLPFSQRDVSHHDTLDCLFYYRTALPYDLGRYRKALVWALLVVPGHRYVDGSDAILNWYCWSVPFVPRYGVCSTDRLSKYLARFDMLYYGRAWLPSTPASKPPSLFLLSNPSKLRRDNFNDKFYITISSTLELVMNPNLCMSKDHTSCRSNVPIISTKVSDILDLHPTDWLPNPFPYQPLSLYIKVLKLTTPSMWWTPNLC